MALFGTQIVISMIMACVLQKLSFSFSFARWLLGKKLFAYLPPSIQELQDAEGIKEESKKHKKKVKLQCKSISQVILKLVGGKILPSFQKKNNFFFIIFKMHTSVGLL